MEQRNYTRLLFPRLSTDTGGDNFLR